MNIKTELYLPEKEADRHFIQVTIIMVVVVMKCAVRVTGQNNPQQKLTAGLKEL